jgi:HSP20 family molecular chaperone IbpA
VAHPIFHQPSGLPLVEVTVDSGVLQVTAEHRREEKVDGKGYYRRELRYGSFRRTRLCRKVSTMPT